VQAGFASAALAQYPADEQTPIRASIKAHCLLVVHGYSQYPLTHACASAVPLQSLAWVQFGVGRVSVWHAPWLQ
jgi:hypothetical protein